MDRRRTDPKKLGGKKGKITVNIEKSKYLKLVKKSDEKNITIIKFIDDMVTREIENSEFLKRTAPKLHLLEITNESVIIMDTVKQTKRIAEIVIRDEKYVCLLDESDSCTHIKFMMIMPEIIKFKDRVTKL